MSKNFFTVSTPMPEATSPASWPPMPSHTTASEYSGTTRSESSLWSRLRPTSVAPANSKPISRAYPILPRGRSREVAGSLSHRAALRQMCAIPRFSHTKGGYVPRQTGKGRRRRQAAFEHRTTQHHEFIGDADPERAEAEFRKHERLEASANEETVREMARELEKVSGVKGDGAIGPEFPMRVPRSVEEGKRMIREAPEALREKARERLERLPEGVRKVAG